MNAEPSGATSSSITLTAPSCWIVFAAYPSWRNRCFTSASRPISACSTFTATRLPLRCVAA